MSSPPPAPAAANDEVVHGEAPLPGHFTPEYAVDAGAAVSQTASSSHQEAPHGSDGGDEDEEYEEITGAYPDFDDDMDVVYDVGDVDVDFEAEEAGKFSKTAEVEATVEALWHKVAAIEDKPSAGHACSVCMEHLTCEGAHRICCIPCGHVYGRSCLERWLRRDGNETVKCPQCGVMFAGNQIIDLYAPHNLWGGCGSMQEVKVYVTKAIAEVVVECERKMEATRVEASSKIAKWKAEQTSSNQEVYTKVRELKDMVVQAEIERRAQMESIRAEVEKAYARMELFCDKKCSEMMLIKEQIVDAKLSPNK